MSFENLNLIKPIKKALQDEGYEIATPIQEKAIPVILEGKDIFGSAQTGTGKTAAYAVPILQILLEDKTDEREKKVIKALIVVPTRELAVQVGESFTVYGKYTGLRNVVVYGGVPQKKQTDKLKKKGADILVATPGRLLDLMEQRYISLEHVKLLVLDEADRMLDMGFIHDIKRVISSIPGKRQTLLFSATMPGSILKLAGSILNHPVKIEISPEKPVVESIKQSLYYVDKQKKKELLQFILKDSSIGSALIFTRTKHGADKLERFLNGIKINAEAIHSNKSQNARQRALSNFKAQKTRVLVATDIAARGIDIDELSYVINYEMPDQAENYIHRIGRTGRAGLSGVAISFCDAEEKMYLKDINKIIPKPIPVITEHQFKSASASSIDVESLPPVKVKSRHKDDRPSKKNSGSDAKKNKSRWFGKKRNNKGNGDKRSNPAGNNRRKNKKNQSA